MGALTTLEASFVIGVFEFSCFDEGKNMFRGTTTQTTAMVTSASYKQVRLNCGEACVFVPSGEERIFRSAVCSVYILFLDLVIQQKTDLSQGQGNF